MTAPVMIDIYYSIALIVRVLSCLCAFSQGAPSLPNVEIDDETANSDATRSVILRPEPAELVPGVVVGQGRYVLAEKLCDVCHYRSEGGQAHQASLPAPSERLLLADCGDQGRAAGELVPYEGLERAILQDLPDLPQLSAPEHLFLPAVHDFSVSYMRRDPLFHEDTWKYRFGHKLGKGAFGEAWRAVALGPPMREVVLKRLFVELGEHVRQSGKREIYFGTLLQNRPHIARFIESFEDKHAGSDGRLTELWLVFHNEGFSLVHHIFSQQVASMVVEPSKFWWHVKQQELGAQVIKNLAYQLLHAVAVAHDLNITHRDIKLQNVLMTDSWPFAVSLGDWGSALAVPAPPEVISLYGKDGPTIYDETDGYQPPEVIFHEDVLGRVGILKESSWRAASYDMWSLGILLLELILGTRDIFHVDDRKWRRVEHELRQRGISSSKFDQARHIQALLDFCLVPPGVRADVSLEWFFQQGEGQPPSRPLATIARTRVECSDAEFAEALRGRDLAGEGLPSQVGRDLLRRLLEWSPERRITAREALAHPWFDDGAKLPSLRTIIRPQKNICDRLGRLDGVDEDDSSGEQLPIRVDDEGNNDCVVDGTVWDDQEESSGEDGDIYKTPSVALKSDCPDLHVHVGAHSEIGLRKMHEDRHSIMNLSANAGFFGVYDGHNGDAVADILRKTFHRELSADRDFPSNISSAFVNSFSKIDHAIQAKHASSTSSSADPGSTALVGVLADCQLHIANLGDCRAVVAQHNVSFGIDDEPWPCGARVEIKESSNGELRGQLGIIVEVRSIARKIYVVRLLGDSSQRAFRQSTLRLVSTLQAVRLTHDHRPGNPGERLRIEALGGLVEPPASRDGVWRVAGMAVSRSLGSVSKKPFVSAEPELSRHVFERGRDVFLVMGSDGVWDVLDDQLVVDVVWDQLSSAHDSRIGPREVLESASQLVVQTALERGALDNLTCIVMLLTWMT